MIWRSLVLLCAALLWPAQSGLAQFTQNGPKLVGTGATVGPFVEQGFSVALSGDGNTAILPDLRILRRDPRKRGAHGRGRSNAHRICG